jgi:hypothetical protein
MIFYLTYNDVYSGIYSSQVIDVVNHLNHSFNANLRLVAFVSLRGFFNTKKKIQNELKHAIVLPMFPRIHRWRNNYYILYAVSIFLRPQAIIGRSVLATQLALRIKHKCGVQKIIYDGRGAIASEWNEYRVITDTVMLSEIQILEKLAIEAADYRIAVSQQLKIMWENTYGYRDSAHVVIPCTLNKVFHNITLNEGIIEKRRNCFGIHKTDVVLIYSGSVAGWQSFDLLNQFVKPFLEANSKNKLFFLSNKDNAIVLLQKVFPNQILCEKVLPNEVPNFLLIGDYGLLVREKSITNKVASPVKFAEYLACGLDVIISEGLGDYTEFVEVHDCGIVYKGDNILNMETICIDKKIKNQNLAKQYFYKEAEVNVGQYKKMLEAIA